MSPSEAVPLPKMNMLSVHARQELQGYVAVALHTQVCHVVACVALFLFAYAEWRHFRGMHAVHGGRPSAAGTAVNGHGNHSFCSLSGRPRRAAAIAHDASTRPLVGCAEMQSQHLFSKGQELVPSFLLSFAHEHSDAASLSFRYIFSNVRWRRHLTVRGHCLNA